VLHDTEIAAGDKVLMYYTSANRDETVFDDPNTFDIHRSPNPHLSFGIGEHFCLGAHLARLEGRVFFEEVLSTFSTSSSPATPCGVRSTQRGLQAHADAPTVWTRHQSMRSSRPRIWRPLAESVQARPGRSSPTARSPVTFRRWKRQQVSPGHRYRTGHRIVGRG
jgi:hypothetical protein